MEHRPITAQRQLLLDILHEARGHLGAKELYRRAADRDPRISLATVYRNLRLFKEIGLVDELRLDDTRCSYEMRSPTEHHHLICTACGQVIEFETPLVARLASEIRRTQSFEVTKSVLYLEGRCEQCGEKAKEGS